MVTPIGLHPVDREQLASAFVDVDDIKSLYAEYLAGGVEILGRLKKEPWGGSGFAVNDPDGNRIYFVRLLSYKQRQENCVYYACDPSPCRYYTTSAPRFLANGFSPALRTCRRQRIQVSLLGSLPVRYHHPTVCRARSRRPPDGRGGNLQKQPFHIGAEHATAV
jgi:hypothetical protein